LDLPPPFFDKLTDPGHSERVIALAREAAAGMKTDYDKAIAIKAKIENTALYDLDAPAVPPDEDAVEYFLFNSKQGYCDLFASAMVIMARAVGIPARYATGYYPFRDERDSDGRFLLRASDRHAWAELFFKDVGWVPFDATEGANEVAGHGRGSTGDAVGWLATPAGRGTLDSLIVVVAGGVVVYLGLPALAGLRRLRKPGKLGEAEARRRAGRLYTGLVGDVRRLTGIGKESAQTPGEYFEAVSGGLGDANAAVGTATLALERCLYSPSAGGVEDLASFSSQVQAARKAVRAKMEPGLRLALRAASGVPRGAIAVLQTLLHLRREDRGGGG
jgi:hypothetical protein